MEITAGMVKELRERTGAGMMDCKKVMVATNGDIEKAIDELRTKGLAKAAKKAGRVAREGIVTSYIHGGGRIGVLVEINCETDFVAKTDDFKQLAHDMAMQIAASKSRICSQGRCVGGDYRPGKRSPQSSGFGGRKTGKGNRKNGRGKNREIL